MPKIDVSTRRVARVTIEFEDGYISELAGDDANKYQEMVLGQATLAFVHGVKTEPLPWKQRNKNCTKCSGSGEVVRYLGGATYPCECTKGPST